jgi:hypothetical protein
MIITSLQQISPKRHPKYSKNLLLWLPDIFIEELETTQDAP